MSASSIVTRIGCGSDFREILSLTVTFQLECANLQLTVVTVWHNPRLGGHLAVPTAIPHNWRKT